MWAHAAGVATRPLGVRISRPCWMRNGSYTSSTGSSRVDLDAEDAGGPHDDRLQLLSVVVLEAGHQTEPVPQRAGDQSGAGGGPHEGEAGEIESDGAGGRPLAQHDVELEVLHGG